MTLRLEVASTDKLVLPPSTVTQAARSSSTIGAVGSRLGTAHVIAPMLTNKDGGRHTNTSRKVSRRVMNRGTRLVVEGLIATTSSSSIIKVSRRYPFQGMAVEVVDDGLALRSFDPMLPRHQAVVLIGLPIPLAPVVELAPNDPAPLNDLLDRNLGLGGDDVDEVDHLVTSVMGRDRPKRLTMTSSRAAAIDRHS